jgi:hypothetical protein
LWCELRKRVVWDLAGSDGLVERIGPLRGHLRRVGWSGWVTRRPLWGSDGGVSYAVVRVGSVLPVEQSLYRVTSLLIPSGGERAPDGAAV